MFRFYILDNEINISGKTLYRELEYDDPKDIIEFLEESIYDREWARDELWNSIKDWLESLGEKRDESSLEE